MKMIVKDIRGCVAILLSSLIIGLVVNAFSPDGIALVGQWDMTAGTIMAGSNQADAVHVREITNPLKVQQLIAQGKVTVVDARLKESYDQGHIPGALSFPLAEFDQVIEGFENTVKKGQPLLIYCSGVTCEDSHTFADWILEMGYTDVVVYSGGFSEWQEMEFEVERNVE